MASLTWKKLTHIAHSSSLFTIRHWKVVTNLTVNLTLRRYFTIAKSLYALCGYVGVV